MADVFISYARQDEAVARRVAKALAAAGLDVWWDADLPAHRSYSEIIERNLEQAKAVVVLWSKSAAGSQWVRAEADFARNAGKLVQGQVDGTLPPMPFNQIQCADLKGWRGSASHPGWAKLQASVEALISGEERAVRAQPPIRVWDRWRDHRIWAAAALALVVAAGVFLYAFGIPGEERKPVLAVLPFKSLDAQDESLVAGMWEDTRTAIGRNPQLIVLGPNTAQELASKGEGAAKKAADYLLEASVRTAGDKIRVSANLVRTKDGEQLWSRDFDRKLDDVFALQSEIASEIEGRIRGRLAEKGGATPEHIATSGEVYALYSDARMKIRKRDYGAAAADARKELQQVLKMDPNFAPAWAALSEVDQMVVPSQKGWDTTNNSEQYARKAIDLAPNLAAAHAALGLVLHKGPVARAELERAVELDPNDYEAWNWLGGLLHDAGDEKGSLDAMRRAAEIEPFFWPAVLNLYTGLKDQHDEAGIQELLDRERRVGADLLGISIAIDNAYSEGNLAEAVNIGLANLKALRNASPVIAGTFWGAMLQLGFIDEAAKLTTGPDFAAALWRNDPKGLDLMESHHIDARTFFRLFPLTENASRVFLLSGRSREVADKYRSLKMTPEQFHDLAADEDHFLFSAPLVALALKQNGDPKDADALLSLAESAGKERLREKPLYSALLARVYAVEGRKEDALSLLASAISRRWLPEPPAIQPDLYNDPALASLKGDPRFEKLREQILGTLARERAQVNLALIRKLDASSPADQPN